MMIMTLKVWYTWLFLLQCSFREKKLLQLIHTLGFFIFNMVDECDKNMGLWVRVHGYGNEKPSVTVFSFSKSVNDSFCFFLICCTKIHGFFFFLFFKNVFLLFEKPSLAVFAQTPYFRNLSQNLIYRYIIFSKTI